MESRFGFRDLLLTVLLLGILVSIWLSMKQDDRQWELLQQVKARLDDQTQALHRIGDQLERGISVSSATNGATNPHGHADVDAQDPFYRIRRAHHEPDYAAGDWLVEAFGVAVGKLTPLVSTDIYARIIENLVLQSLAERDPDTLEWVPILATGWRISDDGLTITFDLRADARFADGSPVTADDVVFTYEQIMDPKIDTPHVRSYYAKIDRVDKDGDHRVVFHLNEPYFKGFEICAGLSILSKKFYSRFTPQQFNETPGLLFGSGPYQLSVAPETWRPGLGQVELVRNDRYWGLAPAFNRIVFREIEEDTARLASFINGEIDWFSPTPEQYPTLKDDPTINKRAHRHEYDTILSGYRYIGWNQQRDGKPTFFADARVRRAMTMLIDRQQMCQRLMSGLATIATGPFHRLGNQFSPSVEPWPYDPPRAIALLKEAGFEDRDGDGVIESQDGRPFRFKFTYRTGDENYHQMALYLKDAFARAGIAMELDRLEWTIMLQRLDERDLDAITLGWSGTIESDPYQIFHSDQMAGRGHNFIHYKNEELDRLIEQARVTLDEEERMQLWHRCHEIFHEDQPYTFLFTMRRVNFVDKRIHHVLRTKLGLNPKVEWYVPAPLQRWTQ